SSREAARRGHRPGLARRAVPAGSFIRRAAAAADRAGGGALLWDAGIRRARQR
ncbi:hypothetical protein MNEG_16092, partial [Monoraphidium neglectum]